MPYKHATGVLKSGIVTRNFLFIFRSSMYTWPSGMPDSCLYSKESKSLRFFFRVSIMVVPPKLLLRVCLLFWINLRDRKGMFISTFRTSVAEDHIRNFCSPFKNVSCQAFCTCDLDSAYNLVTKNVPVWYDDLWLPQETRRIFRPSGCIFANLCFWNAPIL